MDKKLFEKIVGCFKTQTEAAKALGITRQAINQWQHHGVPASQALRIEKVTKGKVKVKEVLEAMER